MPNGTLAQVALSASTNTSVYTVTAGKTAALTVSFCNRGTTSGTIRLAVSTSTSPSNGEWLEYDAVVVGSGVLERTGLVVSAGKIIVAQANSANFSVNVYGYED